MSAKLISMLAVLAVLFVGSEQQYVLPAYYPSYYGGVYSPYAAYAYPAVYAWGSNKGKTDGPAGPGPVGPRPSLLNNNNNNRQ